MPSYNCPRCNHQFPKLYNYKKHLEKRKICEGKGCLFEEYQKHDIDIKERVKTLFELYDNAEQCRAESNTINTQYNIKGDNNTINNITVNIMPYEQTRGITTEEVNDIVKEIVEYNRHLIENEESTDGEYMVAFMTKAIESKMNKNNNFKVTKSGRRAFVTFKTENGDKKIDVKDGVRKLCEDIESDYLETMEVARFTPQRNETEQEGDVRRTKFVIDKELRRDPDKRDRYHEDVAKSLSSR